MGRVVAPIRSAVIDRDRRALVLPSQPRILFFAVLFSLSLYYFQLASGLEAVAGRQTPDLVLALGVSALLGGLLVGEWWGLWVRAQRGPWVELG